MEYELRGWMERKKGLLFAGELPDAFYGQGILSDVDVIGYRKPGDADSVE